MFFKIQFHFSIERWKFNEECQLWVSTEGRIKDKDKNLAKIFTNQGGYLSVKGAGKKRYVLVHRLVMQTWKPVEDCDELTVDHLNHNKRDNSLKNLEWCSQEENLRRAIQDQVETPKKSSNCQKPKKCNKKILKKHPWVTQSIYNKTVKRMADQINCKVRAEDAAGKVVIYSSIWEALEDSSRRKNLAPNEIVGGYVNAVMNQGKWGKRYLSIV